MTKEYLNQRNRINLGEVEIGNLPYGLFKLMILKMFKELGRRMDA